ncbi:MAG: SCO family protein [Pseudomonadota bacterium]
MSRAGSVVRRSVFGIVFAVGFLGILSDDAHAHGTEKHGKQPALADPAQEATKSATGLPFDLDIGEGFTNLIDQAGTSRSLADFRGQYVLVFFGYANCEAICSAALPDMARLIDHIEGDTEIVPIMITVDPERDQPAEMGAALANIHPRLTGMTGTPEALARARASFQVETEQVGTDWFGKPIFNHGSFIYLIGTDGTLKTLLPPIIGPEGMAKIVATYL